MATETTHLRAADWLSQFLDYLRSERGAPANTIETYRMHRITVRNVGRILGQVCNAKGLKSMNPHLLRHACTTRMLNNGASLAVIQQLLGQARISTTAGYAFV